jgi:hypothetical protein
VHIQTLAGFHTIFSIVNIISHIDKFRLHVANMILQQLSRTFLTCCLVIPFSAWSCVCSSCASEFNCVFSDFETLHKDCDERTEGSKQTIPHFARERNPFKNLVANVRHKRSSTDLHPRRANARCDLDVIRPTSDLDLNALRVMSWDSIITIYSNLGNIHLWSVFILMRLHIQHASI